MAPRRMKGDDALLETAQQAINDVFGDTTVAKSETRERLKTLAGDIDVLLDALGEEDDN